MLADCTSLRAALPRLSLLYDLAYSYYPLPLCLSCRSTAQFPSTASRINAASAAMPHSAHSLPPRKRHSRLTIVRRGCKTETNSRDSWRSHVHRTYIAQRVQLFKLQTANVGGRGGRPSSFSGGFKGGILFEKRIPPLVPRRARRSPSRACAGKRMQRCRAAIAPRALWARKKPRFRAAIEKGASFEAPFSAGISHCIQRNY